MFYDLGARARPRWNAAVGGAFKLHKTRERSIVTFPPAKPGKCVFRRFIKGFNSPALIDVRFCWENTEEIGLKHSKLLNLLQTKQIPQHVRL